MKIGEKYKFVFSAREAILTFTGTVVDINDHLVTFIDKYNKTVTYNLQYLISYEVVE